MGVNVESDDVIQVSKQHVSSEVSALISSQTNWEAICARAVFCKGKRIVWQRVAKRGALHVIQVRVI